MKYRTVLGIIGLLGVFSSSAFAAETPLEAVKSRIDQVIRIMGKDSTKSTEEKRAEARKIAVQTFDYTEISRRAMGLHWAKLNPAQQQQFTSLFSDLLFYDYLNKIQASIGDLQRVQYSAGPSDGKFATVNTIIVTKKQGNIPANYRLHQPAEVWLIYDILIEGVSLVSNYRAQFNKMMTSNREGFEFIVRQISEKVEGFRRKGT